MKLFKATSLLLPLGAIDQASAAFADTDKISGVSTIAFEYYATEADCNAGTPLVKYEFEQVGTGCMPLSSSAAPGAAPTRLQYLTATSFKRDVFTDNACTTQDVGSSQTFLFTCEEPPGGADGWRKKSTKTANTLWLETYTDAACTTSDFLGYNGYFKDDCFLSGSGAYQKWTNNNAGTGVDVKAYATADCTGTTQYDLEVLLNSGTCTAFGADWIQNCQTDDVSAGSSSAGSSTAGGGAGSSAAAGGATLAAAAAATCLFVHAAALFL